MLRWVLMSSVCRVESCSEDNNFVCTLLIKNSFIRYLLEKERNELLLKELFHLISGNGSSIATHLIFILEQCSVLGQCWSLFSVRVNLILVSRVSTFNENYSNNYVATGHLPASIMDNRININHQLLCLDPGNWSINTNTAVQANTWFIYIYIKILHICNNIIMILYILMILYLWKIE